MRYGVNYDVKGSTTAKNVFILNIRAACIECGGSCLPARECGAPSYAALYAIDALHHTPHLEMKVASYMSSDQFYCQQGHFAAPSWQRKIIHPRRPLLLAVFVCGLSSYIYK
jgi:hypothetical protein